MKSGFAAAVFIAFSVINPAAASTVGITSVTPLGAIDTFDWGQLGPVFTSVIGPQNVTSNGGASGVVSSTGSNLLQTFAQGPDGWFGNFTPGANVVWDGGSGPIVLSLTNAVSGIGAQIQGGFIGNFTAQIQAFDSNGVSLGSFTENGVSNSNNDGSAIFIGLLDNKADIAKVSFLLTSADMFPSDFAIGAVDITGGAAAAATPLPGSMPLFLSGLLGLFLFAGRKLKKA